MQTNTSTEDQNAIKLPSAWEHWVISLSLLVFSLVAVAWASLLAN